MAKHCTACLMQDCEHCQERKRRSKYQHPVYPTYVACGCAATVEERRRLDAERDAHNDRLERAEWEAGRLERAQEDGTLPANAADAEWHGVNRGPVGRAAVDEVRHWTSRCVARTEKKWLYIYGPRGTGKTTLAGLIAKQAIMGAMNCKYVRWSGLLHDIKSSWSGGSGDPLAAAKDAGLLIIDDFGKDGGSEWVATTAFELIDDREQRGLQTVLTSNYSISSASLRLGQDKASAVEDRLRGCCTVVKLGGESRR